jgi:hypothetical protein
MPRCSLDEQGNGSIHCVRIADDRQHQVPKKEKYEETHDVKDINNMKPLLFIIHGKSSKSFHYNSAVYHAKSGLSFAHVSNCEQKASSSSSFEDPVGILGFAGQI